MSIETIERAAIRLGGVDSDNVWSAPRPCRHHHVIWLYTYGTVDQPTEHSIEIRRTLERADVDQGFKTSTGRFVDRIEAKLIAVAAGQYRNSESSHAKNCTGLGYQGDELFSEDVW